MSFERRPLIHTSPFAETNNCAVHFAYIFSLIDFIPSLPHNFVFVDHETSDRHLSIHQSFFRLQQHI